MSKTNHITVFEHQTLTLTKDGDKGFDEVKLDAMAKYYGIKGTPFFSLINKGVKFCEYVGVIQVGKLVIEVLPKADKKENSETEQTLWRSKLIGMLRAVGAFDIKATSQSNLRISPNSILDLYFELFVREVEYLLHSGLLKQYRKKEGNSYALKGAIAFNKHLQQNLTHQERFYVRHTTYDYEHKLHLIIYKTIKLLLQINTNAALQSKIGALLLNFPEMPDIKVSQDTFDRIVFDRKSLGYKRAIDIAKLILLQYHPDLSHGHNDVLALMFDMNKLWEKFVLVSLKKHKGEYMEKYNKKHDEKYKIDGISVTGQSIKNFWIPNSGRNVTIRPDIIVEKMVDNVSEWYVFDTKWKNLVSGSSKSNISADDLRQMYVYCDYFGAKKSALVYPGSGPVINGKFAEPAQDKSCGLIGIGVGEDIRQWQEEISNDIFGYCRLGESVSMSKGE